jgi:CRISPR-associated protein Cmr4
MKELKRLLFFYTETPVHAGAASGVGVIDLPIQREGITRLPMIAGSGVRGALREQLEHEHALDLFGPEPPRKEDADDKRKGHWQGAAHFSDAQLLLFSARSAKGGWAYVTSPLILARLWRHARIAGFDVSEAVRSTAEMSVKGALVTSASVLEVDTAVVLEDFEIRVQARGGSVDALAKWLEDHVLPDVDGFEPFAARVRPQLVVVADEVLQELSERGTELHTRVRIDASTGTVADGALWNEEALPAECVLWSTVFVGRSRIRPEDARAQHLDERRPGADALAASLSESISAAQRVWLGGDRAVGRGAVALRLSAPPSDEPKGARARGA